MPPLRWPMRSLSDRKSPCSSPRAFLGRTSRTSIVTGATPAARHISSMTFDAAASVADALPFRSEEPVQLAPRIPGPYLAHIDRDRRHPGRPAHLLDDLRCRRFGGRCAPFRQHAHQLRDRIRRRLARNELILSNRVALKVDALGARGQPMEIRRKLVLRRPLLAPNRHRSLSEVVQPFLLPATLHIIRYAPPGKEDADGTLHG